MNDIPGNPFETIAQPDIEKEEIQQISDLMIKLLDKRHANENKKILRGVHPKSHGCVQATFTINNDIAPTYQVGLFSTPGQEYQAFIRFSNAAALVEPDIVNDVNASRGMAIKVFSIAGNATFLQDDNGARNQDFLMINTPSFAFVNTPNYLTLNKILLKNNDSANEFFAPLIANPATCPHGVIAAFNVVQEIKSKPVANPVEVQYFGAAPFLFGTDHVMKFSARPKGTLKQQQPPQNAPDNYLKDALKQRLSEQEPIVFDFLIQVRNKNEKDLGIEDATIVWNEAQFPFIPVATITITTPQLDIYSPENETHCENLAFNPWHALADHQPLGSINRLRKNVYNVSATHRKNS
jgi:catalase